MLFLSDYYFHHISLLFLWFITTIYYFHYHFHYTESRQQLLQQLHEIVNKDISESLLAILKANGSQNEYTAVIDSHLNQAEEVIKVINMSVSKQVGIINSIAVANNKFIKGKQSDPLLLERERVVRFVTNVVCFYYCLLCFCFLLWLFLWLLLLSLWCNYYFLYTTIFDRYSYMYIHICVYMPVCVYIYVCCL